MELLLSWSPKSLYETVQFKDFGFASLSMRTGLKLLSFCSSSIETLSKELFHFTVIESSIENVKLSEKSVEFGSSDAGG